jgi:hypothetical protein
LAEVPEVQLATGVGAVGLVVQVVAMYWLVALGATLLQLLSATGVGPVATAAGHWIVT